MVSTILYVFILYVNFLIVICYSSMLANNNICYILDSTNIADIQMYSNWKCEDHVPVTDPCNQTNEWQGVYCYENNLDEINEIAIDPAAFVSDSLLLTGTLPSQLGLITSMRMFLVPFNQLYGSIPESYCNWTSMFFFTVQDNLLSHTIPSCFGSLPELASLQLSTNRFTGSIPSSIGDLTLVYFLNMDHNSFSQTIPSSIANMRDLSMINLHYNSLTGSVERLHWL